MYKKIIFLILNIFTNLTCFTQVKIIVKKGPIDTPENANIYITGNFNNWNPADESYILTKNIDNYSVYFKTDISEIEYKFTLGSMDKIETDSLGNDIPNRILKVKKNETEFCEIAGWKNSLEIKSTRAENVKIMNDSLYMPQLDRYRRIWVYLPPNYENTDKKYPVLYMHDGQNLFDASTSFAGEWNVDETLNWLYDSIGFSLIVVGIDNGGENRINEMTPCVNSKYGGGDGQKYAEFIVETLKPLIDKTYRTLPERENTGIMGSSLGGLISFYMGLQYNSTFGKIGAFSPSFWFSKEVYDMADDFTPDYNFDLYILAGGKESARIYAEVDKMEKKLLKKNKGTITVKKVANGRHNEEFWSKQFKNAILKLWKIQ